MADPCAPFEPADHDQLDEIEDRHAAQEMIVSGDWWILPVINDLMLGLVHEFYARYYNAHREDMRVTFQGPIGMVVYFHKRRLALAEQRGLLLRFGITERETNYGGPFLTLTRDPDPEAVHGPLAAFQRWVWEGE